MGNGKMQKGKISVLEGPVDAAGNFTRARVVPDVGDENVTPPIAIVWWARGDTLRPQTEVVYTRFEDGSGMIFARADGEE